MGIAIGNTHIVGDYETQCLAKEKETMHIWTAMWFLLLTCFYVENGAFIMIWDTSYCNYIIS